MNVSEYFNLEQYKDTNTDSKRFEPSKWGVLLSFMETSLLSIITSSFNVNTLVHWSANPTIHLLRTLLIILIFLFVLIQKILARNNQIKPTKTFVSLAIAIFIFSHTFIFKNNFLKNNKNFIWPFRKVYFHSSFIFSIVNSVLFSYYLTFCSFYIYNDILYTQAVGLISYLKSKASSLLYNAKEIVYFTAKLGLIFLLFYTIFLHSMLKLIFSFFRISIYYNSLIELLLFIIILCISNLIFYIVYFLIDLFIIFNISYNYKKINISDCPLDLEYHKIIKSYKNKEIKLKNKHIKTIKDYISKEIKNLNEILYAFESLNKKLESVLFINVPQVNKNYSKKYKAFDVFYTFKNKILFQIIKFLLVKNFYTKKENLINIILDIKIIKENENINLISMENQVIVIEMLKNFKILGNKMQLELKVGDFEKKFNKLC